ncbi:hypothetical protein BLSMQ_2119 [Brevibacterium aurantiacum]|uniref:Uncharacterized protein n=1 Tax=Brevibacterium aurantiacum TaxID=273384 RepID=A0A1D7W4C7_BREAU|nr:hypothetical protein BLSMQ_2119 [Brevibacterium aurantiacum]
MTRIPAKTEWRVSMPAGVDSLNLAAASAVACFALQTEPEAAL